MTLNLSLNFSHRQTDGRDARAAWRGRYGYVKKPRRALRAGRTGSGVDLAEAARIVRTMRLRENEAEAIREEVARLDPAARVWLFGSRVDDGARGGDIDLLVRSDRIGFADKVLLKVRVLGRIGAQQLDLVVAPASRPAAEWIESVAREAREL